MKYIDKVVSQLKGYKNTKEIELELFDHLDEHEKFFIDIGYNETQSTEKAEEKMGDADVVVEQFKSQLKNNKARSIILYIIMALMLVAIVLFYYTSSKSFYGMLSSIQPMKIVVTRYSGLVVESIGTSFALIIMLYGFEKKKIIHSLYGYILSIGIIITGPFDYLNCFKDNFIPDFFLESYSFGGIGSLETKKQIVVILICLLITLLFIFGFNNVIKSKRLRNSRLDLKFAKIAIIISVILYISAALFAQGTTFAIGTARNDIREQATTELVEINQFVCDNLGEMLNKSLKDNKKFVQENCPVEMEFYEDGTLDCISKSGYIGLVFDSESSYINTYVVFYNPFTRGYNAKEVWDDTVQNVNSSTTIDDISLAGNLSYCNGYLTLNYADDSDIVFLYHEESNTLELSDSSAIQFNEDAEITEEQHNLIDIALSEQSYHEIDHDYDDNCFTLEDEDVLAFMQSGNTFSTYSEIFDVKYNKEFDTYRIILKHWEYECSDSLYGRYDPIYYDSDNLIWEYRIKFEDGKAVFCSYDGATYADQYQTDYTKKELREKITKDIKRKYGKRLHLQSLEPTKGLQKHKGN